MVESPKDLNFNGILKEILKREPILFQRIEMNCNLSHEKAKIGFIEVLRFMALISYSQKKLTPSLLVDLIWHEFILFTRLYTDICHKYFERYIHHLPGGSDEENANQFQLTLKLYEHHFGKVNPYYWKGNYKFALESDCGNCSSF